jgi:hypothetical protein
MPAIASSSGKAFISNRRLAVGRTPESHRASCALMRFQITFDDGSTTHEWVPPDELQAPLLVAGERERAAAARDGRRPRFAVKAERIREILGG